MTSGQLLVAVYLGTMLFCAVFGVLAWMGLRLIRLSRRVDAWRDVLLNCMAEWRQKEREADLRKRAEFGLGATWRMRESEDECSLTNIYLRGVRRP